MEADHLGRVVMVDYVSADTDAFIEKLEKVIQITPPTGGLKPELVTVIRNVKYNMNAYGSKYTKELHFMVNLIDHTRVCKVCKQERSEINFFVQPKGEIKTNDVVRWFTKKSNMRIKCSVCNNRRNTKRLLKGENSS